MHEATFKRVEKMRNLIAATRKDVLKKKDYDLEEEEEKKKQPFEWSLMNQISSFSLTVLSEAYLSREQPIFISFK